MRIVVLSAIIFLTACSSDHGACDAFRGGYRIDNKVLSEFVVDRDINANDEKIILGIENCVKENPYLDNGTEFSLNKKYIDSFGKVAYSFSVKNITDVEIIVIVGNDGGTSGVFQKSTH